MDTSELASSMRPRRYCEHMILMHPRAGPRDAAADVTLQPKWQPRGARLAEDDMHDMHDIGSGAFTFARQQLAHAHGPPCARLMLTPLLLRANMSAPQLIICFVCMPGAGADWPSVCAAPSS